MIETASIKELKIKKLEEILHICDVYKNQEIEINEIKNLLIQRILDTTLFLIDLEKLKEIK